MPSRSARGGRPRARSRRPGRNRRAPEAVLELVDRSRGRCRPSGRPGSRTGRAGVGRCRSRTGPRREQHQRRRRVLRAVRAEDLAPGVLGVAEHDRDELAAGVGRGAGGRPARSRSAARRPASGRGSCAGRCRGNRRRPARSACRRCRSACRRRHPRLGPWPRSVFDVLAASAAIGAHGGSLQGLPAMLAGRSAQAARPDGGATAGAHQIGAERGLAHGDRFAGARLEARRGLDLLPDLAVGERDAAAARARADRGARPSTRSSRASRPSRVSRPARGARCRSRRTRTRCRRLRDGRGRPRGNSASKQASRARSSSSRVQAVGSSAAPDDAPRRHWRP